MDIRDGWRRRVWPDPQDAMKAFAPVVRQAESKGLLTREGIQSLTINTRRRLGAVTRLRVAKLLHSRIGLGREKGCLDVNKDVAKIKTGKATAEVTLAVGGDDVRETVWGEGKAFYDVDEL